MSARDLSCVMKPLVYCTLPIPLRAEPYLLPTISVSYSSFSAVLWTCSIPLLLYGHSGPYFRHAFKVQILPAHPHSFPMHFLSRKTTSSCLHFLNWNTQSSEPPSFQTAQLTKAPFINVHCAVKRLKSGSIYLRDYSNTVKGLMFPTICL